MKLTSNDETLAESKVLILYILSNIKRPISNNALYKIILSVFDMNYFYFQQFLLDLINSDFVLTYEQEEQHMYMITDKGTRTLELTEDILPGIIKLQVDTNLKYTLDDVNEENSIVAEYTPVNENYYNVTCKIMENNECLFEIKTFAGSREQAKQIVDNWKRHAGVMYPDLLKILTQDFKDDPIEESTEFKPLKETIGSPLEVYNYDVLNRSSENEEENVQEDNSNTKTTSNSSYVIEGNLNLFDMMDKNNVQS